MTCPGCDSELGKIGMIGTWLDALGRFRGAYALCPRCTDVIQHGSQSERGAVAVKAELSLMLAERSPSREAT
jgi:hypothetical protein